MVTGAVQNPSLLSSFFFFLTRWMVDMGKQVGSDNLFIKHGRFKFQNLTYLINISGLDLNFFSSTHIWLDLPQLPPLISWQKERRSWDNIFLAFLQKIVEGSEAIWGAKCDSNSGLNFKDWQIEGELDWRILCLIREFFINIIKSHPSYNVLEVCLRYDP